MDAVLGLSVTPSAVGLVLVEGQDADGATVDREAFEILPGRASSAQQTSDQAAAAVLRTEANAAARGHRLHSIGVTWSDDADTEASLLLKSLTDCGFDNVVPVRLPEATEALAWGIAEVIGHDVTAVCVIEPETVIVLIVHSREGAVQTAINHTITTQKGLIGWLSAVFARADWQPEALVVVGTGGDFSGLMPRLEDALSVPVFAPAEAELALARGAALASTHNDDFRFADDGDHPSDLVSRDRRWPAQAGPLAMLVGRGGDLCGLGVRRCQPAHRAGQGHRGGATSRGQDLGRGSGRGQSRATRRYTGGGADRRDAVGAAAGRAAGRATRRAAVEWSRRSPGAD